MDSTLIQTEVIDELAIRAGVGEQVKAITESAMQENGFLKKASASGYNCSKVSTSRSCVRLPNSYPSPKASTD